MIRKKHSLVYYKNKTNKSMKEDITNWNDIDIRDLTIILQSILDNKTDELPVKHYSILETHIDKIEDYILTGELKLYN